MEEFYPVEPLHGQGERIELANGQITTATSGIEHEAPTLDVSNSGGVLAETMELFDVQEWLNGIQEKIMNWDFEGSLAWDAEPDQANELVRTIDEIRALTEELQSALLNNISPRAHQIQDQACGILELAMERLEEEFTRILIRARQSPDFGRLSFQSTEEDHGDRDFSSVASSNDESFERRFSNVIYRSSSSALFEPVDPASISDLRCIADLMHRCAYSRECLQAYIFIRKAVSEDCFALLCLENLSIQELVAMDSTTLHVKIKKWIQAVRAFTLVYLPSERRLCDSVFESDSATCFCRTTKGSFFKILRYGEAIAISPPEPEKIFDLLNMYECLTDLMATLRDLFSAEGDSSPDSVVFECNELLSRLGESVVGCFLKLKDEVRRKSVTAPYPSAGPFHITKFVMNYISAMTAYRETLCFLFQTHVREHEDDAGADETSALRRSLLSLISVLEEKICEKSRTYPEDAQRHFFMMNNIHYMVKKVKGSELQDLFGDNWVRAQHVRVRQHARDYRSISWNPILSLFKDEGIRSHGSMTPSRNVVRDRFRSFNVAFEGIYKIQTAWLISDEGLRDDVTISISQHVLQAYRHFRARHEQHLDGIHQVRFSVDDLEIYVLDLFKNSQKNLRPLPQ